LSQLQMRSERQAVTDTKPLIDNADENMLFPK